MTVPDFGPLAGVTVVSAGQALAGPFTGQLMAEFGADVIWIENPQSPDLTRSGYGFTFQMERRNERTIALSIPTEKGREILLKLLARADIFVESSKGGQYERWGLSDDVLWEANPALVVVHTSGYGIEGVPEYVRRASFDPIAQAYGCYLQHNGPHDRPPLPAVPFPADYLTGLFGAYTAVAALLRSRSTGIGESIDLAMYEVLLRAGGTGPMAYLTRGIRPERTPRAQSHTAGCRIFPCLDGSNIYVIVRGAGVVKRMLEFVGLDSRTDVFPPGVNLVEPDTPAGDLLESTMSEWFMQRSAAEADRLLNDAGIPASIVYTYDHAVEDPHYRARETFIDWEDADGNPLRGVGIVPKLKNRPGRVWRGAPKLGADTEDILRSLEISDAEITELYAAGVVARASQ
jgi:L-carnitine CoA-transferase